MRGGRWGQTLAVYLFLGCTPSALGELAGVVHGGSSASGRLSTLAALRVEHPPWAFPCPFVLHPHKAAVQREVVPDWVLRETERQWGESVMTSICPFSSKFCSDGNSPQCKSSSQLFSIQLSPFSWPFLSYLPQVLTKHSTDRSSRVYQA